MPRRRGDEEDMVTLVKSVAQSSDDGGSQSLRETATIQCPGPKIPDMKPVPGGLTPCFP
jgi:hypothetical protein